MIACRTFTTALAVGFLAMGCSSPDDPAANAADAGPPGPPVGFAPPPAPENGVQILGKPFTVQPGTDIFMCVYLSEQLTEELALSSMTAYQMTGGHHVIFSWVNDAFTPETDVHVCDEVEMVHHRLIGVTSSSPNFLLKAPEGVAFKAPAGKRLVIQSHYINATDSPMEVMDAINLISAEGEIRDYAAMMVMNDATFALMPNETTVREMTCTVTEASEVFMLTGHTHEWGKQFTLDVTRAGSDQVEVLFDAETGPNFRNEPPLVNYSAENTLKLSPGDKLHMRCEWFNDQEDPIYFPKEMCSAPMFYFPSRGFETCLQDGGEFVLTEL